MWHPLTKAQNSRKREKIVGIKQTLDIFVATTYFIEGNWGILKLSCF